MYGDGFSASGEYHKQYLRTIRGYFLNNKPISVPSQACTLNADSGSIDIDMLLTTLDQEDDEFHPNGFNSMVTTIIIIVVLIGSLIFISFTRDLIKDKQELKERALPERYGILLANINAGILNGHGELTTFDDDPRSVNMMDENRRNVLIQFHYSTGTMTIILLYLYYHRELKFKQEFHQMRNADNFRQRDVANAFVEQARIKMAEHERQVTGLGLGYAPNRNPAIDPSSVDKNDDPELMIQQTLYGDMTQRQKNSAANAAYLIMKASGTPDTSICNHPVFSQFVRNLEVNTHEAKMQLQASGEPGIIADLKDEEEDSMDIILLNCFSVCAEDGRLIEARLKKFIEIFGQLGLDEEEIANRLQKIQLFGQLFGG